MWTFHRPWGLARWGLALCIACLCACTVAESGDSLPGDDDNVVFVGGKADNFFSNVAREYLASSAVTFRLHESYATSSREGQRERALQVMDGKTQQIGWFLNLYLMDKQQTDKAGDYGGLRAMVLDGSYARETLRDNEDDPLAFSFTFRVQVGGSTDLLSLVRARNELEPGDDTFTLKMIKYSNEGVINFTDKRGSYKAGSWSPETCGCEVDEVAIKLTPIDASRDAYLDYLGMLQDDVLDIGVHLGWDYGSRLDLTHSRNLFAWLTEAQKFKAPVSSFEQLNRLSGPLSKQIVVPGPDGDRTVTVQVSLFHPDPCRAWNEDGDGGQWAVGGIAQGRDFYKQACADWSWEQSGASANSTTEQGASRLSGDLKQSLANRDAVIFGGHSAFTYGFAMSNWYVDTNAVGELVPAQITQLQMPSDRSQLVVASGCDTYHVGQAFKDNESKGGLQNLDVITTTSFSQADALDWLKELLVALGGDAEGKLEPYTYGRLLNRLNPQTQVPERFDFFTMYGVHGIDDNPRSHPFGDPDANCSACERGCEAAGNACLRLNRAEKICAVECVDDSGCAEGYACKPYSRGGAQYIGNHACVPVTGSCHAEGAGPPLETKQVRKSGLLARTTHKLHEIEVGAEARDIVVRLVGNGDADLLTRFGEPPTVELFDCAPDLEGTKEHCEHAEAQADTLYVLVNNASKNVAKYKLTVTWVQ